MNIIVRPNAEKNAIGKYDEARDAIRVNIKAPPEDNKANIEVIRLFSKETGKKVKIVSGFTSKRKCLKIED
ncbi:MAG: YggU family protein [Nanoarchaeota archaeon]|nr:YggU family protein [Nanoarchaeota archaeon]